MRNKKLGYDKCKLIVLGESDVHVFNSRPTLKHTHTHEHTHMFIHTLIHTHTHTHARTQSKEDALILTQYV